MSTIARNQLQAFMADGNSQTTAIDQEAFTLGGATYYGTFGPAQLMPDMQRHGYRDSLVTEMRANRDQFANDPESRQTITRVSTGEEYLIQLVDTSQPVLYVFMLVAREA